MKIFLSDNNTNTESKRINVSVVVGYADPDSKVAASTYEKSDKSFNIPDGPLLPAGKEIYIDPNSQLVADYDSFIESVEDLITDYYNLKIYYKNSSADYSRFFGMLAKDDNGNVIIDFDFTMRISNHTAHRTSESQKHKKERKAQLAKETGGKKIKPITKSILVNDKEFSSYLDAYEYVDKVIGDVVSKTWAKTFLKQFPEDTIEYVQEYKNKIDSLHVVELQGDDWVECTNEDEIARLNWRYSTIAYAEGYVDDIDDFDKLYEALCLLESQLD